MNRKRILIVEDERIVAMNMKEKLESAGYEVIDIISTAKKAIKMTNEEKPAAHALDRVLGKKIWQISHQMTGLDI